MRQSLELRLGQRLSMTPQLQQAIRLLQLSSLELRAEIQQALESNPLLDDSEEEAEAAETQSEADAEDGDPESAAETDLDLGADASNLDDGSRDDADQDRWDDEYETGSAPTLRNSDNDAYREIDARASRPQTLRDHLDWQLRMLPLSARDQRIGEAIIDSISDDGYLGCELSDIVATLAGELPDLEEDETLAVLHLVQSMDPPGVGARDLGECLHLQLRHLEPGTPGLAIAERLAAEHLELLARRDFNQIKRVLKLDDEELQAAVHLITHLNPRPGGAVQDHAPQYIIPDVVVRRSGANWRVELNAEAMPRIGINRQYQQFIRRGDNSAENKFLQDQLQEARWLLKSLRNRNNTLLRVARAIVKRQREFLEHGEEAMKPMVLQDIAAELDMHESTISRVTTQKYMLTPGGVFELKFFFSSRLQTTDGGTRSATAIRSLIRKIIDNEEPNRPVSDNKIVEMLSRQGISVARRTIAKYRDHMKIPPSSQRRSLV
ncbi:MAG: RNA polymerase factor sigma-54 [Gammaproteobacteria bacterium]|jgi:RNA polymerase sigma-54 factor|nr:RNA polymerase factor sigma-54 [Gammaproteobacteria bacterium]